MNKFLPLILLPWVLVAQPTISNATGTFAHGQSISIIGTGFGTKSQAAPVVWDNCSGTDIATLWDGAWPSRTNSGHTEYITHYTTPIRSVGLPHSNITKYIAGCHGDQDGFDAGYNVMVFKGLTYNAPKRIYMSWYEHEDPSWTYGDDNNFKSWDYSCGATPMTTDASNWSNWYISITGMTLNSSGQWTMNDDGGSLENPDRNGHNYWWGDVVSGHMTSWFKTEVEVLLTDQTNGYIRVSENGTQTINYLGYTDRYSTSDRSRTVAFGGYARLSGQPTNWRYFSDIYYDTSLTRVVLGNNATYSSCTVREMQVPTSWSNTAIAATLNCGTFASNATAYLFVIDSSGTASSGYQVTLGGSVSGVGNKLEFTGSRQ